MPPDLTPAERGLRDQATVESESHAETIEHAAGLVTTLQDRIRVLEEALTLLVAAHQGALIDEGNEPLTECVDRLVSEGLLGSVRVAPTEDYEAHITRRGLDAVRAALSSFVGSSDLALNSPEFYASYSNWAEFIWTLNALATLRGKAIPYE